MIYVKLNKNNVIIDAAQEADSEEWVAIDSEWPIEYISQYGEYLLKVVDGVIYHRSGADISTDGDDNTAEVYEEEAEQEEEPDAEVEQLRARVALLEAALLELM